MLYDFYYSKNHENHMRNCFSFRTNAKPVTSIRGKVYTEAIEHRKEPITKHFGDLELVVENGDFNEISVSTSRFY